jgi:tRNA (guanine37-N1)-methyltransferase
MLTFHVITLFPESLDSYLNASIVKRAQEKKLVAIKCYNPRDFVAAKKGEKPSYADRRVDDRPYGGGPGMVIEALPVIKAVEAAIKEARSLKLEARSRKKARAQSKKIKIIFFSPAGKQFSNSSADSYKRYSDIILICGRYEGIDARIKKAFPMTDISVGPYTLTGGELPAMIVIDSITRRIPNALGHDSSIEESRVASPDVYTRPESFEYKGKKYRVPKVLLSGHHAKMDEWKMGRKSKK